MIKTAIVVVALALAVPNTAHVGTTMRAAADVHAVALDVRTAESRALPDEHRIAATRPRCTKERPDADEACRGKEGAGKIEACHRRALVHAQARRGAAPAGFYFPLI